jgi:hypothetical protein
MYSYENKAENSGHGEDKLQLKYLELKKMESFRYYRSSKTNGRIQKKLQTE